MTLHSVFPQCRRSMVSTVVPVMLLLVFTAAPASAHVALDAPTGGEVLDPGSVFTIAWHETINHGRANWDLWYSTTGENGPWIVIVEDINQNRDHL